VVELLEVLQRSAFWRCCIRISDLSENDDLESDIELTCDCKCFEVMVQVIFECCRGCRVAAGAACAAFAQ